MINAAVDLGLDPETARTLVALARAEGIEASGPHSAENIRPTHALCNLRKGNRLPEEVQMRLHVSPTAPTPSLFVTLSAPRIPDWRWRTNSRHWLRCATPTLSACWTMASTPAASPT